VIGVQHAKGASWEEERDGKSDNEMKDESVRVLAGGKENMTAPLHPLVRTRIDLT
jgi:hypothetical protein